MKRRAVFLDRDGTISDEVGYVDEPSRFQVFPYSAEAIKQLNDNGWLTIVVTNQSGVARGLFPESMIHELHERLQEGLQQTGAKIDALYYCPHHPAAEDARYLLECDCRKPLPGMIQRAAAEWEIDLGQSWMIGDRYIDVELAHNAGVRSALVMTGFGRDEWELLGDSSPQQPDLIADNLLDAVEQILQFTSSEAVTTAAPPRKAKD
jgi:D-glycero-D-manno-heptose 1,7-bisphosphate phosphatase